VAFCRLAGVIKATRMQAKSSLLILRSILHRSSHGLDGATARPPAVDACFGVLAIGSGPRQLHPLTLPSSPGEFSPQGPSSNDSSQQGQYLYEPLERFGEGLTTRRPWNTTALAGVERLNGRVAMVGFAAAVVGEWITGHGPAGQLLALLRWYLGAALG
jgi:hypothetical protein